MQAYMCVCVCVFDNDNDNDDDDDIAPLRNGVRLSLRAD